VKKANTQWYAYEDLSCYYRLVDGELWFCPMMQDGSRGTDEESGVVEDMGSETLDDGTLVNDRHAEIIRELNASESPAGR
jgi:hypothetical protein